MKRIFVMMIVTVMLISSFSVLAKGQEGAILNKTQEKAITEYIKKQVIDSYSLYYNIPTIVVEVKSIEKDKSKYVINADVHFTKELKAKTAYDLPYIQGMLEEQATLTDQTDIEKSKYYIQALVQELENDYIGVEQGENSEFEVSVPANVNGIVMSEKLMEMKFIGEDNFVASMRDFAPPAESELHKNGKEQLKKVLSQENEVRIMSTAQNYDRVVARNYIRKWTDACGGCHCSSCKSTSVYNPAYSAYCGNDCANYVSQAIYAGGLPTDTEWAPGKYCWYNTGHSGYGLVDYMVAKGYFFKTTSKSKAFAGSIIKWTTFSHVGMVDQNDTVTMTYCAHTNDRYQSSFKNSSGVEFYVPVWDSYSNNWTPQ